MEKAGGMLRMYYIRYFDGHAKKRDLLILEDLSVFPDYTQSWSLIKSEFRHTQRARQFTTKTES